MQQQYTEAVTAYQQTLKREQGHLHGWLNLAKAQYEIEEYRNAAHSFLQAYTIEEPVNIESLYFSAASSIMAEDYIAAIERI